MKQLIRSTLTKYGLHELSINARDLNRCFQSQFCFGTDTVTVYVALSLSDDDEVTNYLPKPKVYQLNCSESVIELLTNETAGDLSAEDVADAIDMTNHKNVQVIHNDNPVDVIMTDFGLFAKLEGAE